MKLLRKPLTRRVRLYQNTLIIAMLFAGAVVPSKADVYTIGTKNTSLQIDLASGITQWTVDGVNQLNLQSFYYSVGANPVASIYGIGLPSAPTITTNGFVLQTVTLNTSYADSIVSVGTRFALQGYATGSSQAKLTQTLTINNLSSTAQVFHFYQYSDFDLGGVSGDQNVQFFDRGSGLYYQVVQTAATGMILTGLVSSVSGGTDTLSEVQAGLFDGNKFGLDSGGLVTLDNTLAAGPGNTVYAYEWETTLAAGASITVSEIQTVVPEPSSVALVASGMLVLGLSCRRRQGGQRHCRSGSIFSSLNHLF